jgi:hypothetical protein
MPTECSRDLFGFAPVEGREVVAAFDGGAISRSGVRDDGAVCGVLLRCAAPGPDRA